MPFILAAVAGSDLIVAIDLIVENITLINCITIKIINPAIGVCKYLIIVSQVIFIVLASVLCPPFM